MERTGHDRRTVRIGGDSGSHRPTHHARSAPRLRDPGERAVGIEPGDEDILVSTARERHVAERGNALEPARHHHGAIGTYGDGGTFVAECPASPRGPGERPIRTHLGDECILISAARKRGAAERGGAGEEARHHRRTIGKGGDAPSVIPVGPTRLGGPGERAVGIELGDKDIISAARQRGAAERGVTLERAAHDRRAVGKDSGFHLRRLNAQPRRPHPVGRGHLRHNRRRDDGVPADAPGVHGGDAEDVSVAVAEAGHRRRKCRRDSPIERGPRRTIVRAVLHKVVRDRRTTVGDRSRPREAHLTVPRSGGEPIRRKRGGAQSAVGGDLGDECILISAARKRGAAERGGAGEEARHHRRTVRKGGDVPCIDEAEVRSARPCYPDERAVLAELGDECVGRTTAAGEREVSERRGT